MACPTCDHTMQSLIPSHLHPVRMFWCPRCGTIKTISEPEPGGDSFTTIEPPRWIEDLRNMSDQPALLEIRQKLGLENDKFELADLPMWIKCKKCGKRSAHPEDVRRRYCGHCRRFHSQ